MRAGEKMKAARVLITKACQRSCSYCCNEQPGALDSATTITDLSALDGFEQVLITGGEPMLYPDRILSIVKEVRERNPGVVIFLYSALYVPDVTEKVIEAVDGFHFTLHHPCTADDVEGVQAIQALAHKHGDKSFRLYLNPDVTAAIRIYPYLWARVEVKPWMAECPLPEGEQLFTLKGRE